MRPVIYLIILGSRHSLTSMFCSKAPPLAIIPDRRYTEVDSPGGLLDPRFPILPYYENICMLYTEKLSSATSDVLHLHVIVLDKIVQLWVIVSQVYKEDPQTLCNPHLQRYINLLDAGRYCVAYELKKYDMLHWQ